MKFSVMITTRNRCEDLKGTLSKLAQLKPKPDEILVCADGCDDATATMVRESHPEIRFFENASSLGSVGSRKRLLAEASGDWVLSLDDDSYPLEDGFFRRIETIIADHPEASVITFPEQHEGGGFVSPYKAPESPGHYVSSYANCGAIMDRHFYNRQPGFPSFFVHMYEEPDYALQCYAAGSSVWFEPSLVIRHHLSPVQRYHLRRHHQNARNELWSVWMRCPWPFLPVVSIFRMFSQLRYACREGIVWFLKEHVYWLEAIGGVRRIFQNRRPVTWHRYFAWMRLARTPLYTRTELNVAFRFGERP